MREIQERIEECTDETNMNSILKDSTKIMEERIEMNDLLTDNINLMNI